MVAPLPPLRGGVSDFSARLVAALKDEVSLEVITFRSMYPEALHPGGGTRPKGGEPAEEPPDVTIRARLNWHDPLGWLLCGMLTQADVVHIQHWSLPLIPVFLVIALLFRLRNKAVVLTLHNVRSHERSALYVWSTNLLCRLAHRCVVHWEKGIEEAGTVLGVSAQKMLRIPMGVSPRSAAERPDPVAARRALGLPQQAPVVLCAGHIRPYKGVQVMLRALPDC